MTVLLFHQRENSISNAIDLFNPHGSPVMVKEKEHGGAHSVGTVPLVVLSQQG